MSAPDASAKSPASANRSGRRASRVSGEGEHVPQDRRREFSFLRRQCLHQIGRDRRGASQRPDLRLDGRRRWGAQGGKGEGEGGNLSAGGGIVFVVAGDSSDAFGDDCLKCCREIPPATILNASATKDVSARSITKAIGRERRGRLRQTCSALCREPYEDRQRDDDGQRGEGGDRSGDQGDELDSLDDAHPGAGSGWRGRPGHVVRDDGAGYGNGERRDKTLAILTLRQFRYR